MHSVILTVAYDLYRPIYDQMYECIYSLRGYESLISPEIGVKENNVHYRYRYRSLSVSVIRSWAISVYRLSVKNRYRASLLLRQLFDEEGNLLTL